MQLEIVHVLIRLQCDLGPQVLQSRLSQYLELIRYAIVSWEVKQRIFNVKEVSESSFFAPKRSTPIAIFFFIKRLIKAGD